MHQYIALFYSHYEASQYKKKLCSAGVEARLVSVPRSISSSCGTCCRFSSDTLAPEWKQGVESIYEAMCSDYVCVYQAE